MAAKLLTFVTISLLSLVSALPPETITNAADTLSNSGYVSMSLTLTLVSTTLLSNPASATIFAPPDTAFTDAGQPSLSLLQLHFSPLAFSISTLRSLPFATKVPTLSTVKSLSITTPSSSDQVYLNNVKIVGPPIFDDGLLIVFGVERFFDPNFTVADPPVQIARFDHCTSDDSNFSFHDSGNVLISRGYSVMASFLNLQLLGLLGEPTLTLFAPADEVMVDYSGRFPDYSSLFLRHVLPCKVSWRDLVNIHNATDFETYLSGFAVKITRSGDTFKANDVPIAFPDMYYSDWFVIHGVREVFSLPQSMDESGDVDVNPIDDEDDDEQMKVAGLDRTEF